MSKDKVISYSNNKANSEMAIQSQIGIGVEVCSMRFLDLCDKDVININNCKYLGHVRDLEFDECTGCICAIIVPGPGKYMGCICRDFEFVIPWSSIVKIGPDIILVNLIECDMKRKVQG